MRDIRTIAVYCASSSQVRDSFFREAYRLGEILASEEVELVYGDGGIGLMGELAKGVLSKGGKVTGVIPQFMVDEGWNNPDSTRTYVVETMHERKAMIERLSDGMVAMPGGIGTFEELLECLTWKQLGLHVKPVVILNVDGYYDGLLRCIDTMVAERMIRDVHRNMYKVVNHAEEVLPALRSMPDWDTTIRREAAI